MLDMLESLPLPITTLIVAGISALGQFILFNVGLRRLLWLAALAVPFCVAYCFYWAPNWIRSGESTAEYSAWAPLVIGIWSVCSAIACLLLSWALLRNVRQRTEHA